MSFRSDLKKLMQFSKESMVNHDSAHDFSHISRVYKMAEKIGVKEKADMEILLPAVLLHDLKLSSKKTLSIRKKTSDESAYLAYSILKKLKYDDDKITKILYCIKSHSFSKGITPKTIEAKVLQDADRLDAIGAIGIARCFSTGEEMEISFYNVNDPFAKKRKLNDSKFSLDHFYVKLTKLKNKMNTEEGRKLTQERHEFLVNYLKQIRKEI